MTLSVLGVKNITQIYSIENNKQTRLKIYLFKYKEIKFLTQKLNYEVSKFSASALSKQVRNLACFLTVKQVNSKKKRMTVTNHPGHFFYKLQKAHSINLRKIFFSKEYNESVFFFCSCSRCLYLRINCLFIDICASVT